MYSARTVQGANQEIGVVVFDHAGDVRWTMGIGANDDTLARVRAAVQGGASSPSEAIQALCEPKLLAMDDAEPDTSALLGLALPDAAGACVLLFPMAPTSPLVDFLAQVPFATDIMEYMISNPYQGITVADAQGKIRYLSPVHERFLGLPRGGAAGRDAADVIPNSRLAEVARTGQAEIAQLQQMRGITRVVNRLPIRRGKEVVGAIGQVLFKDPESVQHMLRTVLSQRVSFPDEPHEGIPLLGSSAPMQRLRREIATVAHLDIPVLILGESGTGKELVAKAIHQLSSADGTAPLVSLNLAAIPATLLDAELFGYEPGTFTGASRKGQLGRIEQAQNGTLFLDEVGDIPIEMQVKLLRVLEDRRVQRLGGGESRHVQFRLITATNRNMQQLIEAERFRLDLYYRLSGVVLHIPALRHRREDIPELLNYFVSDFCRRNGIVAPAISSEVLPYLAAQPWPGNVRQLRQRIEEALVFCDLRELRQSDFERYSHATASPMSALQHDQALAPVVGTDAAAASLKEREYLAVCETLKRMAGNKKRAAEALGISRSHLYKILGRAGKNRG